MGRISEAELNEELVELLRKLSQPPKVLDDYYTKEEIDLLITEINNYLDIVLTVDKTYTKEIIDFKLGLIQEKLDKITSFDNYTKEQIDQRFATLRKLIAGKLDAGSVYTKDEVKQLIQDAVNGALPDVTGFYTKKEVDNKLNEFLRTSDIVDGLTTDTDKPVSVNQYTILNSKIESLKQSASDGKSKTATAITGIGIPRGGSEKWEVYRDDILGFNKPMSEEMYYAQTPQSIEKVVDFSSSGISTLTYPVAKVDPFTGNLYILSKTTVLVYDTDFNLLQQATISLPRLQYDYSGHIVFSSSHIYTTSHIVDKSSLTLSLTDQGLAPIGLMNDGKMLCGYKTGGIGMNQSGTTIWNYSYNLYTYEDRKSTV